MHLATIVAVVIAVIGFILGLFIPTSYLGTTWLLFAIALLLFLILRESTLSHIRGAGRPRSEGLGRKPAERPGASEAPAEPSPPANLRH